MQELGLVGHGHLADPHEGLLTGAHIDSVEAGREAGGLTDNVGPLESGTGCLTAEDGHELAEGLGTVDGDLQDAGGAAGGDGLLGVVDETVVAGALKTVEGGIAAAEKTGHETVADERQVGGWGDSVGIGSDTAEEGNALGAVERRELADADLTVEHALADEQTAYSAVVLQTAAGKEQRRDNLVGEAVGDDVALEHHGTDIIVGERLGTADGHETVGKLTDGLTQGVGVPAGVALAGGDILVVVLLSVAGAHGGADDDLGEAGAGLATDALGGDTVGVVVHVVDVDTGAVELRIVGEDERQLLCQTGIERLVGGGLIGGIAIDELAGLQAEHVGHGSLLLRHGRSGKERLLLRHGVKGVLIHLFVEGSSDDIE